MSVETTVGGVTYRVTPEYLAQAASDCNTTAGEISGQLATLKTFVMSLKDVWQGPAKGTFDGLMAEWDRYANMLHESLTDIGSGLQGNYVNYVEGELTNIKNIDAIQDEIGGYTISTDPAELNLN